MDQVFPHDSFYMKQMCQPEELYQLSKLIERGDASSIQVLVQAFLAESGIPTSTTNEGFKKFLVFVNKVENMGIGWRQLEDLTIEQLLALGSSSPSTLEIDARKGTGLQHYGAHKEPQQTEIQLRPLDDRLLQAEFQTAQRDLMSDKVDLLPPVEPFLQSLTKEDLFPVLGSSDIKDAYVFRGMYQIEGRKSSWIFTNPVTTSVPGYPELDAINFLVEALEERGMKAQEVPGVWIMEASIESPEELQELFDIAQRAMLEEVLEKAENDPLLKIQAEDSSKLEHDIKYAVQQHFRKSISSFFYRGAAVEFGGSEITTEKLNRFHVYFDLQQFLPRDIARKYIDSNELRIRLRIDFGYYHLNRISNMKDYSASVSEWLSRNPHPCNNLCLEKYQDYFAKRMQGKPSITSAQVISSLENFDEAEWVAIAQSLGQLAREYGKEDLFAELVGPNVASKVAAHADSDSTSVAQTTDDEPLSPEAIAFGQNLRAARKSMGMNQTQLARHLSHRGLTQSQISLYESGRVKDITEERLAVLNTFIAKAKDKNINS